MSISSLPGMPAVDGLFITSLAFNLASFQSIYHGGVAFTATDPLLGSIFLLILWFIIRQTQNWPNAHGVVCAFGSIILSIGGAVSHILKRDLYQTAPGFHNSYWLWAVCLNCTSSMLLVSRAFKVRRNVGFVLLISIIVGIWAKKFLSLGTSSAGCSDHPFFNPPPSPLPSLPVKRTSQYLLMSDGVKLAVDTYLPGDYDNETLPTFLHLTRYHRAEQRSILSKFMYFFGAPPTPDGHFPMRSLHYINTFVPSGYAFVSVDVRGTGASFGSRPVDLSPREVQDFGEIAQWVKDQPFCNGRIGTGGISYDGITGALMAAQGNIAAAALLFAPGDIYEDIAFVGGIPTTGFVDLYGKFTTASENNLPVDDVDNELPPAFKLVSKHALHGVAPVMGYEHLLSRAVKEHEHNFDMLKAVRDPNIQFKDSTVVSLGSQEYSIDGLGIGKATYEGLKKHQVSVYSVAGYYDSASIRSAARLHNFLVKEGEPGQSKLTIGPWSHGARACWTPRAEGTESQYPLFQDVKRFFDCKLKDDCENIKDEAPLHFFLSGEDKWKSGDGLWPPVISSMKAMPLNEFAELGGYEADSELPVLKFNVHFNATSGPVSRWNLVFHLMKMAVTYPNLESQLNTSLSFTSSSLDAPLTIIGSARLSLSISLNANASDAALFVYLEEVNSESGVVHYITEGVLRLSHSSTSFCDSPMGAFDSVKRSYTKADQILLTSDQYHRIEVLLEPIAYTVPMNHKVRVRLAGADMDNFYLDNIKGLATSWNVDIASSVVYFPVLT